MTSKRWPVLVFIAACLLGVPRPAAALLIAQSELSFSNFSITPAGTFSLGGPWDLSAFASANNSLGETDGDFASSVSPDSIGASAAVTWASANGTASAPNDPANLAVTGSAKSGVSIPNCDATAFSTGRGTLSNFFFTVSGTDPVALTFSVDIFKELTVMTGGCHVNTAKTETIFSLAVDGELILFDQQILFTDQPNDFQTVTASLPLSFTKTLDAGLHSLIVEVDSESEGLVIPEPPAGVLLLAGLAALAAVRHRPVRLRPVA